LIGSLVFQFLELFQMTTSKLNGNVELPDADPHPIASGTETPETGQEARNDALATAMAIICMSAMTGFSARTL
jgi:hypothetical protein